MPKIGMGIILIFGAIVLFPVYHGVSDAITDAVSTIGINLNAINELLLSGWGWIVFGIMILTGLYLMVSGSQEVKNNGIFR